MTESFKKFFKELEINGKNQIPFMDLYFQPATTLGVASVKNKNKDCRELSCFEDLFLNNDFLEFLAIGLYDSDFTGRLNPDMLSRLLTIIGESKEFHDMYPKIDGNMMALHNNEISIGDFVDRSGQTSLMRFITAPIIEKYGDIIKKGISREKVDSFEVDYIKGLKDRINELLNLMEKNETRKAKKEAILNKIKTDDYVNDISGCFLSLPLFGEGDSINPDVFYNLVCEDRFVTIMKKLMEKGEIHGRCLYNAIEIINASIGIKNYSFDGAYEYREMLGVKKVNDFNLKDAINIANNLDRYAETKKTEGIRMINRDDIKEG